MDIDINGGTIHLAPIKKQRAQKLTEALRDWRERENTPETACLFHPQDDSSRPLAYDTLVALRSDERRAELQA